MRETPILGRIETWTLYSTMDSPGVNCVDRHKEKDPNWVALIWEKDEPAGQ